jgi:3-phytase
MLPVNSTPFRRFSALVITAVCSTWLPAQAVRAEALALPEGRSVQLDKRSVRIDDAQGQPLAQWTLRARHPDARSLSGSSLVAVVDADRGQPVLLRVDTASGRVTRLPDFPRPGFAPAALCLYRDPQQLLHLFLLADNGLSQQWLLRPVGEGFEPLLERQLATPLEPKSCRVDDASQTLWIPEQGVGLWAYRAEAEGSPQRRLLNPPVEVPQAPVAGLPLVQPLRETALVASPGDAADDPAIWERPGDRARSRLLATDKKLGLMVYDLQGRELQRLPVGRINNVDLRQGLRIDAGPRTMDLAVATHRDEDSVVLFGIDKGGKVSELARLPSEIHDLYGVCAGRAKDGFLHVVYNNKDGELRQVRVQRRDGVWQAEVIRRAKLDTQPEGCVFDEVGQRVFVGEEKRGVWSMSADPAEALDLRLVLPVGAWLHADVEGLGIYRRGSDAYLVISSQGNSSFVVMDLLAPHAVRGAFRVGINPRLKIDGVSETDGLAVSASDFGPGWRRGMLVVQDGYKNQPQGHQNFKLVSWDDVRQALQLP